MVGKRMNQNKISVVIPSYNSKLTIIKTIESVLQQSEVGLIGEIIVVDDGSTDESIKLINKFIKEHSYNIIKLITQANGGVSKARNVGILNAKFKWIALLDSDDVWFENKIEYQWNIIETHENIDFLGGNWTNKDFNILCKKINSLYKASVIDICMKNFPQPSTVLFKKTIFDEIGGFDENQRYAEDGNYFLKICGNYNFYFDPVQVIEYGDGKSGFGESGLSKNIKEMHLGNLKNVKEIKKLKLINKFQFLFILLFFEVKYFRRIILVKLVN